MAISVERLQADVSVTGAARAAAELRKVDQAADRTGRSVEQMGGRASRGGRTAHAALTALRRGALAGGAGIGAGLVKAAGDAMTFDKTMRTVAVQTKASSGTLRALRKDALDMGKATVFSAQDAGNAMLELAKGGLTSAQIRGGALATTMKLAAAGNLDLASASTYVVQGLTTFGIKAKNANKVATALAGGANASTASVESMGQALSQVGPGAKNAGLSLQETVAALAAFDNAGIKGSDAGTSLKTMLQRLVPQTDKAKSAMERYNLEFVKSDGSFKSLAQISQNLRTSLRGLSEEQRTQALNTIFGSDASRAAAVLMDNGRRGVEKYTRAARDQNTVQKMANVSMRGASGAWENLKGAAETASIRIGTKLLPTVEKLSNWGTNKGIPMAEKFADAFVTKGIPVLERFGSTAKDVATKLRPVAEAVGDMIDAVSKMPQGLQSALAIGAGGALLTRRLSKGANPLAKVAGSALGGRGVVPVYVTNLGKGVPGVPGGGVPGGGKPSRVPVAPIGVGARLAAGAGAAANTAAFFGIAKGADWLDSKLGNTRVNVKRLDDDLKNLGRSGHASGGLAKTYGADLEKLAKSVKTLRSGQRTGLGGLGGMLDKIVPGSGGVEKITKNFQALDTAMARLQKRNPEAGQRAWNSLLKESGVSASDLAKVLPKASANIAGWAAQSNDAARNARGLRDALVGSVAQFRRSGLSASAYGKFLRSLPDTVRTKMETPGAIKSAADVRALGRQFDLTPRQVRTLIRATGVKETKRDAVDVGRALNDVGRLKPKPKVDVETRQATSKSNALKSLLVNNLGKTTATPKAVLNDQASGRARGILGLLNSLNGRVATSTVRVVSIRDNIVRNSVTNGGGFKPGVNMWTGGYTGDGGKYEPKGVVHGGEFVHDKETTQRARPLLEALHRTKGRLAGYTKGGPVKGRRTLASRKDDDDKDTKKAGPRVPTTLAALREFIKRKTDGRAERQWLHRLDRMANKVERASGVHAKLVKAIEARDAKVQAKSEFRTSVREGISAQANVLNAGNTAGAIRESLTAQAGKAKQFAADLQHMRAMGYSGAVVQQVAAAGIEGGSAVAQALVAGSATDTKGINAAFASINSTASSASTKLAGQFYDSGIKAANGLIAGLRRQEKALRAQAASLGRAIAKALKRSLQQRSPSRVTRAIGVNAGSSLGLGLADTRRQVTQQATRLGLDATRGMRAGTSATPALRGAQIAAQRPSLAGVSGGSSASGGVTFVFHTYNAVAEPQSRTTNKALARAGALGKLG